MSSCRCRKEIHEVAFRHVRIRRWALISQPEDTAELPQQTKTRTSMASGEIKHRQISDVSSISDCLLNLSAKSNFKSAVLPASGTSASDHFDFSQEAFLFQQNYCLETCAKKIQRALKNTKNRAGTRITTRKKKTPVHGAKTFPDWLQYVARRCSN